MNLHQKTISLTLALLTICLSTARASDDLKVTIAETPYGMVTADRSTAVAGDTVTLTITPADGYKLRNSSLVVEQTVKAEDADSPSITRQGTLAVGAFVALTALTDNTYSFVMPTTDVNISAQFRQFVEVVADIVKAKDSQQPIANVSLTVTKDTEQGRTMTLEAISLPEGTSSQPLTVFIPEAIQTGDGETFLVSGVAADAFLGLTGVTDIYLPETEAPLEIGRNAFRLDETGWRTATIHTPLSLLDDYALMPSLTEEYNQEKIQATAKALHKFWTFSCGVDVILPEGVSQNICQLTPDEKVEILKVTFHQLLDDGREVEVIKANNGVLLSTSDMNGGSYEIVACPSNDRPSGMTPPTYNAESYGVNLLEPVTVGNHFEAGERYYILSNNKFHSVLDEAEDKQVPPCKAVLHLSGSRTRSLSIYTIEEE